MTTLSRAQPHAPDFAFSAREFAFALAWEMYAPGLGGWTVQRDAEDDGTEIIVVDPPLVYGDGFSLRRDAEGVRISSQLGIHRAANLRDALLLICPLGREALEAADQIAALPTVDIIR